jgi:RNA polymerase sigma-70 factor (ECF subfamily)
VSEDAAIPEPGDSVEESRSSPVRVVTDAAAHVAAELPGGATAAPATPATNDAHAEDRHASAHESTEELMAEHGDALFTLCLRVLREPVQAEDVLQQVFLEAHRDRARFEGRATLRTWLFSIAIHRCQDAIKAKRRLFRRIEVDERAVDAFEDPRQGQEVQLQQQRQLVDLAKCLGALSPDARLAILLHFQLDMSFDEMEKQLRTKSDTLQTRVRRALPVLRRCLERKGWTRE